MAEDIAPALYEKIKAAFDERIAADSDIQRILSGKNKAATFVDVSLLSRRAGTYAVESLTLFLTEETMPDGRLYWNIMERTILPIMREVYAIVNRMAAAVQTQLDEKQGIGIKPIKADFPQERIETLMNRLDNIFTKGGADERTE